MQNKQLCFIYLIIVLCFITVINTQRAPSRLILCPIPNTTCTFQYTCFGNLCYRNGQFNMTEKIIYHSKHL